MNILREEFCKEINTPMGLDNVYDYVKWLEKKLYKQEQALQLLQTDVSVMLKAFVDYAKDRSISNININDDTIDYFIEDFNSH